jgi:hypothetical protein
MQKQGLLNPGWRFPPEHVVKDASHAETETHTSGCAGRSEFKIKLDPKCPVCSGATCELFIWKIPQNVWVENLRNMFLPVISPVLF